MSPEIAIELVQRTLKLTLMVGGPLLLAALLVGLLISLGQAVTQIQEQTLTFIPKLLAVGGLLVLLLPWIVRTLVEFTLQILRGLPGLAG
jgi:flagellar biosynthesis protein FliQ